MWDARAGRAINRGGPGAEPRKTRGVELNTLVHMLYVVRESMEYQAGEIAKPSSGLLNNSAIELNFPYPTP